MRKLRAYVDPSVFGGVHDEEFADESRRFFELVKKGAFVVLVSEVTVRELRKAPQRVRDVLAGLAEECTEFVDGGEEADALAEAYMATGLLRRASSNDAAHVATATVVGADVVVSWNFHDIVRYDRIQMFKGVSVMNGYRAVDIMSPLEVLYDEE